MVKREMPRSTATDHLPAPTRVKEVYPFTVTGYTVDTDRPHVVTRSTRMIDGKRRSVNVSPTPAFTLYDDGEVVLRDTGATAGWVRPCGKDNPPNNPHACWTIASVEGMEEVPYCIAVDGWWAATHVAESFAKLNPIK